MNAHKPRPYLLLAALLLGNIALAAGAWFVREADTGPVSAGFWRLTLALPFFWLLARSAAQEAELQPAREASGQRNGQRNGQSYSTPNGRALLWLFLAGACFAADVAAWHVSLDLTRMSNSVLFANSGSLVLMVWGFAVLGIIPRRRDYLAIVAALSGIVILLGRSLEISAETVLGDGFSLFSGLMYAAYLLIVRDQRQRLGPWNLLFWTGLAGAPLLLGLALWLGEPVLPVSGAEGWAIIAGLVLVNQLLGQGLLIYALPHFPPLVIGLALLTQPAVAALVGYSAFGEVLAPMDLLGMALLAGALVMARTQSRSAPGSGSASLSKPPIGPA